MVDRIAIKANDDDTRRTSSFAVISGDLSQCIASVMTAAYISLAPQLVIRRHSFAFPLCPSHRPKTLGGHRKLVFRCQHQQDWTNRTRIDPVDSADTMAVKKSPGRRPRFKLIGIVLLAVVGLGVLIRSNALAQLLARAEMFITEVGVFRGALVLFCINLCTVLLCFPFNMATIVAGATVLGAPTAFVPLYLSKLLASCIAFTLARGVLAPRIEKAIVNYPKIARALESAGSLSGIRFVLLTRLSPLPGFALNYLLSLTSVRFREYALGTAIGIIPSVLNLCLIGAAARDVASGGGSVSRLATVVRFGSLAAMLFVSILITRSVRSTFAKNAEKESAQGDLTDELQSEASSLARHV